ncbi:alpha/beta hydrolase [Caenimonas sedimenti]|uniref:Alpha/beta hydrolase n=1 Tax=Caenimonas sedimenti TaxID=2596921 RepID=A0A562ZT54_9BURK|nr:alpha/beta hydrolase [Caenimonas sedimenti]TWO71587.1 alpha/beta hydrolase [Caenimonas sedimenti]
MPGWLPARLGALPPIQAVQTRQGRLSYLLSGSGPATILLFNGAGVSLEGWRALYPEIEQCGTVFGWNRFGMQGSDPPKQKQTGTVVVASLRELLGYAGLAPPYILVAHSLGGLYANLFARLHPGEVTAVLFVEATHPRDRAVLRTHETQLVRALGKVISLPQLLFKPNVHAELECVDDTVREIEVAGPFPDVPVRVITGGKAPPAWLMSPAAVGARRAHQQELARLSPHGEQVIAHESGHFPQLTQPEVVLEALRALAALTPTRAPVT